MFAPPVADTLTGSIPEGLDLEPRHFRALQEGSGLSVEIIRERGYRTVHKPDELRALGFSEVQSKCTPGLLLPGTTPDGGNGLYTYRPDFPRTDARRNNRELKYEIPAKSTPRVDVPRRCLAALKDPSIPLYVTEGMKKADALADRGRCAAAILGAWNWKSTNEAGGITFANDWDYIALNGRRVRLVPDSDYTRNKDVRAGFDRLREHLERKGAVVSVIRLPEAEYGSKQGADDYLKHSTIEQLDALEQLPEPTPRPAVPVVELLDEAPRSLTRPIALIDGHAYAACWPWVKRTIRESEQRGKIVRHDPPLVERARELYIVRDDGAVFGLGERQTVDDLGFEIRLPTAPRDGVAWRASGIGAYRAGHRPDAADVFRRIVTVYDRFIDFNRSLADQLTMCELSACFSLATWFCPACTVVGYAWPNGERGSGKTQWLNCWAGTSYLGTVLLSSGSFAAIRDLADYGAALGFDDAEAMSNPRTSDPEKRELLLAGNRRGACVTLKEPRPDGTWATRYVDAFGPRSFSAIGLPDPVLASRSIVVPLARTADPNRGNADPADPRRWPCDQDQLRDDLWASTLWLMTEAEAVWSELDAEEDMIGREYELWRAVLMVARLFERHGVNGLEARIRSVIAAYQVERSELIDTDRTVLVVRALRDLVLGDTMTLQPLVTLATGEETELAASRVVDAIKAAAEADERDAEWATPSRIGRILKRLRIPQGNRTGTKRSWRLSRDAVIGLARAYGLPTPESEASPPKPSVTSDTSVIASPTAENPPPPPDSEDFGDIGDAAAAAEYEEGAAA